MANGDEASELVRMILHGSEVVLRLGGSALKNTIAFLMAMHHNNKVVHGKKSVRKLMKNFKDLRTFTLTQKQFQSFRKNARQYKFPYAGIGDKKDRKGDIDLLIPQEFVGPANLVFDKIGFTPPAKEAAGSHKAAEDKKKERQPTQSSRDTKAKSTTREANSNTRTRTNNTASQAEKPSVEGKLLQFHKLAKAKQAAKPKTRIRAKAKGPKR